MLAALALYSATAAAQKALRSIFWSRAKIPPIRCMRDCPFQPRGPPSKMRRWCSPARFPVVTTSVLGLWLDM
jgi:hypothetical protein